MRAGPLQNVTSIFQIMSIAIFHSEVHHDSGASGILEFSAQIFSKVKFKVVVACADKSIIFQESFGFSFKSVKTSFAHIVDSEIRQRSEIGFFSTNIIKTLANILCFRTRNSWFDLRMFTPFDRCSEIVETFFYAYILFISSHFLFLLSVIVTQSEEHTEDTEDGRPHTIHITEEENHHTTEGKRSCQPAEDVAQLVVSHSSHLLTLDHEAIDLSCLTGSSLSLMGIPRTVEPDFAVDGTAHEVGVPLGVTGQIVDVHDSVHWGYLPFLSL